MDERVLDVPWLLRKFIVVCTILPKRPKDSAHAYQSIWWPEGSPLVVISRRVEAALREKISLPVALGMRYGNPSIEFGIKDLMKRAGGKLDEVLLVPLYPHYAMSSYETVVVLASELMESHWPDVELRVQPPFYNDPDYIEAMFEASHESLAQPYDHILFSYHGIPERHVKKTDPTGKHCLTKPDCCSLSCASPAQEACYKHHCFETTRLFAERAGLSKDKYSISFQSRLGRDPWLQPFTDYVLEELPKKGIKNLLVICPSFVSDCLETLEEIAIRGRDSFIGAGGEKFAYIPCMNENPRWIETLAKWSTADDPRTL